MGGQGDSEETVTMTHAASCQHASVQYSTVQYSTVHAAVLSTCITEKCGDTEAGWWRVSSASVPCPAFINIIHCEAEKIYSDLLLVTAT